MKLGNNLIILYMACLAANCNAFWNFNWECRTDAQGDVGVCQIPRLSSCEGGSFHSSKSCYPGFRCCIPNPPPLQQVCTNLNGERGVCLDSAKESCDGGVFQSGFCRGTGIQCCIQEIQTSPPFTVAPTSNPTPNPTPTPKAVTSSPTSTPTLRPTETPTDAPVESQVPRIRKEAGDLTPEERSDLVSAINKLREEGTWEEFAALHAQFFSGGIHNNAQFWPWHRVFILVLEEELTRVAGKPIFYPYWDWTKNARNTQNAPVFEDDFFGGFAPSSRWSGCVESGPFLSWSPCLRRNREYRGNTWDTVDVQSAFSRGSNVYDNVRANVERLHNAIHNNIGGDMATINSPIDPVFWAHHAYIDKIWSDWQSLSPSNERAYAEGLSSEKIIHYEQYTVEDTFNMRPYEGVDTRRRLFETVHKHVSNGALSKDRVLYAESSRNVPSFSRLSKLSPQQLAKVPRTCSAPQPDSELIVFWHDDMMPLFEASSARVESTEGETDDCINHAALNVLLAEVEGPEASKFSSASLVAVIGGVVAFSVIATVGAVMVYRRRQAAAQESQLAITEAELPEL